MLCRKISWPRVRLRCSWRQASMTNVCHKGALARTAMSIRVIVVSWNEFAVALKQTAKQKAHFSPGAPRQSSASTGSGA